MNSTFEALGRIGLIPVITIERVEHAAPLARALMDAGLGCAEITFRTAAAAEAISSIAREVPDMLTGAGTVLTIQQAEQAVHAGARYIVSPGFDAAVVDWCLTHDVPVLPGVVTPTEINMALAKGLTVLKFFPSEEVGGMRMLKVLYGPYPQVRFVPTGGINAAKLPEYLALPNVLACGGSWMATATMIAEGQFSEITRVAAEARSLVVRAHRAREEQSDG
ncbi:MAG TPA: bifunctional 4-hydroxy-2-oxoglutarate aldolase/2-dehydro-3-deoxy-phosphogluconate aldolase [Roseiflexaceae bacterium]|nr:bifunctional 4-hydroxy-2-oxoglutarate aldolase/2-dehydro-3-deoxy-phosphogluconate aldolase [Roseiflexaceae bacterium]